MIAAATPPRNVRLKIMPSSVIRRWDYEPDQHRLDIEFVSGRRYSYHDVPERIARGMRKALSKGSYFNRRIRDHFAFTRRDGEEGKGWLPGPDSNRRPID